MSGATPFIVTVKTCPDIAGGKRAYGLMGLSDAEALQAISTLRHIHTGSGLWPLPLRRISAVAVAGFTGSEASSYVLRALGTEASREGELLGELATLLAQATAGGGSIAVGWQGRELLWPLLECRCMVNGLSLPEGIGQAESPIPSGPAMADISLRQLAALCGEPHFAEDESSSLAAQRQAAEVDALLLSRLCLRLPAARRLDSQRQRAGLEGWASGTVAAHLAVFAQTPLPVPLQN